MGCGMSSAAQATTTGAGAGAAAAPAKGANVTALTAEMFELQAKMAAGTVNPEMGAKFAAELAGYFAPTVETTTSSGVKETGDFGAMMAAIMPIWHGFKNTNVQNLGATLKGDRTVVWPQKYTNVFTLEDGTEVPGAASDLVCTHTMTFDASDKMCKWDMEFDAAWVASCKEKAAAMQPGSVFFMVYHTFLEDKADAWWAQISKAMNTPGTMEAMAAKQKELGFHNHLFMPEGGAAPVCCLWEAKSPSVTDAESRPSSTARTARAPACSRTSCTEWGRARWCRRPASRPGTSRLPRRPRAGASTGSTTPSRRA